MTLFSKFHPLLVHFPIALVLAAAVAELVVITTARDAWRTVAVANIRAGAAMGVVAAITGWLFAASPLIALQRVGLRLRPQQVYSRTTAAPPAEYIRLRLGLHRRSKANP